MEKIEYGRNVLHIRGSLYMYKANEFLKFKEIEINGTSVTNG